LSGQAQIDKATMKLGPLFLAFLPDPSTFEGAVTVAVVSGLVLALILGSTGWLRHRRRKPEPLGSPRAPDVDQSHVADLVTGIGQAVMGVRGAIELFGKAVLLEDPESGELEENSRQVLIEAYRRVEEAEARLPRVQLLLGDRVAEGRRAIEELRSALGHLSDYIRQPGWGEDWSYAELEAARTSLTNALKHEQRFLRNARA